MLRGMNSAPLDRRSQAVPALTQSGVTCFGFTWALKPKQFSLTVVVKATMDLQLNGPAVLRSESEAPSGAHHYNDDLQGTVLYPSDFAVVKPRAEVLLRGQAFPNDKGGETGAVRFAFGDPAAEGFDHQLAAVGQRHYTAMGFSQPKSFESIPLVYERTYGGPSHEPNPVGLGLAGELLPQLESPNHLLLSRRRGGKAVCFAGSSPQWPSRRAMLGTFDEAWKKDHFPYFPSDFDATYFLHAAPEQQLDKISGTENFILAGLRPDGETIVGQLPGLSPRCFLQHTQRAGSTFSELGLRLDTVVFDSDEMKVNLIWRGLGPVADDEASNVAEIFVAMDDGLERMTQDQAHNSYRVAKAIATTAEPGGEGIPANETSTGDAVANENAPVSAMTRHTRRLRQRLEEEGLKHALLEATLSDAPIAAPRTTFNAGNGAKLRELALKLLANSDALDDCDLAGGDLRDLDFSGRSLKGANFKEARLERCCFDGANLEGAVLAGADLSDARLNGANLSQADLSDATLTGASLQEARLDDADFSNIDASKLDACACFGVRAQFGDAQLPQARFEKANLPMVDFIGAQFEGANFNEANMPDMRCYDAQGKASFKHATIPNTRADGANLSGSNFQEVKADESVFDAADLKACNFRGASLPGCGFVKADCSESLFEQSDLREARLSRSNLRGAQLQGANLMQADLQAADLRFADLRQANLYAAELFQVQLEGTALEDALLAMTKLENA